MNFSQFGATDNELLIEKDPINSIVLLHEHNELIEVSSAMLVERSLSM